MAQPKPVFAKIESRLEEEEEAETGEEQSDVKLRVKQLAERQIGGGNKSLILLLSSVQ